MQKLLLLSTLLLLTLAACNKDDDMKQEDPPSNVAIYPKIGMEMVKLGDTAKSIQEIYGDNSQSYVGFNDQYTHFLWYPAKGLTFYQETTNSTTYDENMTLQYIIIESPYEKETEEGIKIGSTKAEVIEAYGDPDYEFFSDVHYDIGSNGAYWLKLKYHIWLRGDSPNNETSIQIQY